jgi:hypothetical protein
MYCVSSRNKWILMLEWCTEQLISRLITVVVKESEIFIKEKSLIDSHYFFTCSDNQWPECGSGVHFCKIYLKLHILHIVCIAQYDSSDIHNKFITLVYVSCYFYGAYGEQFMDIYYVWALSTPKQLSLYFRILSQFKSLWNKELRFVVSDYGSQDFKMSMGWCRNCIILIRYILSDDACSTL